MRSLLLVLVLATPAVAQQASCLQVIDGKKGCGSGTVVRPNFVLTNRHMVSKNDPKVVTQEGKEYTGLVRKVSTQESVDLALIQVPELPLPPVGLAPSRPSLTEKLRQFGFPLGKFRPITGTRHRSFYPDSANLFLAMPSDHGDSGAGVFNEKGELVGVCVGGVTNEVGQPMEPRISINVDIKDVRKFLGPTLQVVSMTTCGPCQRLKKELDKVTVDVQVAENATGENVHKATAFPTLVLYDENLNEVKRTTGFMTADEINTWVEGKK